MTKKLSPHDRFTRSSLSHPKVSEEFFQKHLPEKIKNIMDFSSIELQKESYIDDNLKLQIADLLFSVKFDGQSGFLYILFEHASTPDPLLPFRMLKYMIAIKDHHLKAKKTQKLPLVYPMILYTGEKPYAYSMDLFDLFSMGEKELAKDTLMSPYHLIDLTQFADEELKHYHMFGLMARALKHIHDPDILPFFINILEDLGELSMTLQNVRFK
ncbi:MAG TPA: Rpn family recombination-promoting nuclease/putative transposase [Alphaproteobacteria bacterium]|nr:Rpn family recombination-promoting nuclease/putative transposase [Alphaproteobacteria bacterium]